MGSFQSIAADNGQNNNDRKKTFRNNGSTETSTAFYEYNIEPISITDNPITPSQIEILKSLNKKHNVLSISNCNDIEILKKYY
ncbi:MAG: hypothetical protein [Cotesia congregata filamentous virus 2]